MALYNNNQKQAPDASTMLCYQNQAICDRVIVFGKDGSAPVILGYKRFHCLRRFTFDKTPQCATCMRDMTKDCFTIERQYYSPELVALLVKVYSEDAKRNISVSSIWSTNRHYNAIIVALKYPKPVIKEDHYAREERHDTEVTF